MPTVGRPGFSGGARNTRLEISCNAATRRARGGVTDFLGYNLKRAHTRLENDGGARDCGTFAGSIPTAQMVLLCGRVVVVFPWRRLRHLLSVLAFPLQTIKDGKPSQSSVMETFRAINLHLTAAIGRRDPHSPEGKRRRRQTAAGRAGSACWCHLSSAPTSHFIK